MDQATASTTSTNTLRCALELSKKSWLLAIRFRIENSRPLPNRRRGRRKADGEARRGPRPLGEGERRCR